MMNLVVKVKSSLVQGKPLQGRCLADEGNSEVGKGGPGERDQVHNEVPRPDHSRISAWERRSVIDPDREGRWVVQL